MPPPDTAVPQDAAAFRRWRWIAHACLGVAACAWVLALLGPRHLAGLPGGAWGVSGGGWAMLRLMAESGLVGGLADWFAITALFRRPLGLPIPHTALVPRNRDRIADGIAAYIDNEFLAPAMLRGQIRRIDLLGHLSHALQAPATRDHAVEAVMAALPRLVTPEREAVLRTVVTRAIGDGVAVLDLRPVLARILEGALTSPEMEGLITDLSDQGIALIHDRRGDIRDAVAARSKWWVPRAVDASLADQVADAVTAHLYDLRSPHSDAGRFLRQWLADLPTRIDGQTAEPPPADAPLADGPLADKGAGHAQDHSQSPDHTLGQRLSGLARAALGSQTLGPLIRQLLDGLRAAWAADAGRPDGMVRQAVAGMIDSLTQTLNEPAMKARIDAVLEDAILAAIPAWRRTIRDFVAGTLRAQDIGLFTRRLEARVGRDLQYVRINGTVLGALIGAGLHLLAQVLGQG